jgi:D-xylonolactonase
MTRAPLVDLETWTGEGPIWHPDERALYWVDIPEGRLYRYDPHAGNELVYERDGTIGGVTVQDDGALLLFADGGTVVSWNGDATETVVDGIEGERDARFNDVIADPRGRVFCGSMPTPERDGRLYRLDRDGTVTRVLDGVEIPNGMAFTPDRSAMYFAETEADRIHRFAYDEETGELSDRATLVDTSDVDGYPDGLTIDAAGTIWVAFWNGNRIARYARDGTERRRVGFPARKVSSIVFGGVDYADAYVTTALGPGEGEPETRADEGDWAGSLFRIDLGVRGVAPFRSRIER